TEKPSEEHHERDRVQKKTFTKWINQHLFKVRKHINDLYEDLRDGHNLISLLEVLSGDTLPREKGRMRFHRLQNVQIALDYLKRRQVKLVNIRNDDITDGNPKLTLGLIWTIILHFQISEIHVAGQSEDMTAKERLLFWSKQMTDGYVGVRCDNFTTSWRDGRLFNAIIHKYRPDLVDMSLVSTQSNRSNLEQAFDAAEQLGVARLLDPEDVDVQSPDEKSVITYVSTLYDSFPKVPDGGDGINANDVDIKWVEYQNMIKYLSQWIKHNVTVMSDRAFPNNPVELKALYTQYLQFKEHEIPLKENEKTKINHLYEMLEVWIEFGRIQLPAGHHPNDIEKEWGKLIVAMLEREKSLRPEVERLEMLQQIANRVQRDCVNGEDKLSLARTALQSDAKRLEAGIQFQNEAEIAGYLLECENTLRQQVMDIQMLLDGKFPFADQLVQRVSKLRDDLLSLRTECSSVYNQGRTLTAEQTKRMISGISNSLNFAQNANPALSPALSPGGAAGAGSTFTSSGLGPALTPGLQPQSMGGDGGGGGMEPMSLQHLKHAQILKPLVKPSLLDTDMTEGEANMNFVQDLLNWVEEMQVQVDRGEWGTDLPSVETQIDDFKSVHQAIEEFQTSLKEAKHSEFQMTVPLKHRYSEKLSDLESNYEKLLNCSRKRQSNLEKLHDFVSRATQELIWLNEKEEEEVAFDWSDRNGNINNKRDYHADLMRELEEKEEAIKSVQDKAESLMLEQHPARPTIEAYRAAMQTQWNWILQLCSCVEQHLKENAVYFEFFGEAKESLDRLKNLQDAIHRKYSCDRTSSLHKLEDLVQESMEKEQLLQYSTTVAGLVGRAKTIVQLRPRNPDSPVRSSIPVKAICDYRQIEITIFKDDECVLASNAHRAKWKVINPGGNEAMVPSVCFTVPPPNKEALEMASRIEQTYQNVLSLWHHSHVNMKSVVSWHYLMADIRAIRNWNVASVKTLLSGAHQQEVLSNLDSHFEEFLADSEESEVFTVADRAHSEREVEACKQYYEELLRSAEREEHEESQYNHYISEVRNFRMHLEAHEEHLIRKIRTPLDRDDLEQSQLRISEQEKKMSELDQLKGDLEVMKEKCEVFLKQASTFPSLPTLSSELLVLVQNMGQVYSMSSIFMDKLKTVSLVVENSQRADALVKVFESKLYEEDAVNCDLKSIETVISTLKHWRSEMDEQQEVFHDMEDELKKARSISERMFKVHNERDFDLDWHREKADQLSERWHSVHSQIDNRLRELESISKSLKYYKDSFSSLDEWVKDMEAAQLKAQENQPEDSKALAELLNTQKVLVAEIEQKQSRITECQKHSEQYSSAVKDYELQLMTYRAMVDSQHKSPLKKRRMQNSSDAIQQEFMDLRTRYTALVTLMTQCVKFASETLRRAEEEEVSLQREKSSLEQKTVFHTTEVEGLKEQLKINRGKISRLNSVEQEYDDKMQSLEEELSAKQLVIDQLKARCSDQRYLEATELTSYRSGSLSIYELVDLIYSRMGVVEDVNSPIAGLWDATQKKRFSVFQAVQQNLVDRVTALRLLEAQVCTGGILDPASGEKATLKEALGRGLLDQSFALQLPLYEQAYQGVVQPKTGKRISVAQAVQEGVFSKDIGLRCLEFQLLTGGLIDPETRSRISLEEVTRSGFLDKRTLDSLKDTKSYSKSIICPKTRRGISFMEALERSFHDYHTGLRLLEAVSAGYGERGIEGSHSSFTPEHIKMLFADGNTSPELLIGQGVGQSQQTDVGLLDGGGMTADEAVQCDLMRHSTTLIVLDKQKGFTGLLIPSSDEITIVSSWSEHRQLDSDYSSTLLRDRPKIAAFYIPENDEVVDIDSATKLGFIDHHTAELLKSIEFPAALPDIEQLNAKFSSWLMLRELTLDGNRASGDLESSIGHPRTPSPSEMRQLLTSYLMMNSYLDTKSEQRLVVLDRRLTNMVQHLVEDLALSESQEPMCSSDDSDVYDISRQGGYEVDRENYTEPGASLHIDEEDTNDLSRNMLAFESHATVTLGSVGIFDQAQFSHAEGAEYNAYESTFCVSIESGSFDKDNDYTHSSAFDMRLDETQLTHMEVTEYNADDTVCVSTEYISYDEDRDYTHSTEFDMSLDETQLTHVEVAEYSADDNTVCISTQYISFEKSIDNTHSTEFEGVNTQYYLGTEQERNNYEGFDIPMLSETSNFPTSCSGNVLTSHSLSIKNNSESYSAALNSSDETQSDLNPNSLCIRSGHTNDVSTEPSCFQRVPENTLTVTHKNTYALEKAQIEQGDILSHTTSVDNYSPERPVFNELASGSLVLQLSGEEQRADEKGPLSVLKQSVPSGSESSYDALHINDPPSLLGSGCDINSNCLVTMGGNLAFKDVSERVTAVVPPSDPTPRAIINPEESVSDFTCIQRIPGLISGRDQESSLQHFTESKVAVMMLDVPDEQIDGMGLEGRSERAEWRSVGKAGEISHPPHPVLASFISHGPAGTQMSSSVSWNQVTEASSFPHNDGALSPRADLGRQEMIHSQLTHTINQYETASQNHAQPTQSPVPDQTDRAFDCSIESPLAHEYTTLANLCCEGDGSPVDRDFLTDKGCYGLPGNPTVSPVQSDSGMSSSHSDVLSEESKTENVSVSLAQSSLISEHSQARDDALPRDVFESAVSSCTASRGDDEREITGASHEITYPEQPFGSEGNCSVEMKPASAVLQAGIGDTGCIQAGADSNNRLESDFIAADVVEFGRDIGSTISLEEQHGQSLTMTNDGMPVCLSTDPDTIETRMIGLSDTTMKIDCCSNKTISADIHSDRLPNDKQTGSQTVISADGNRCSDYTFAQSPTSFSGGLSDSPIVIGDTGCIQAGADSNNWLESDFIAADVVEFGRDIGSTISLEEQHGQSLTMTNDGMPVCLSTDPDTIETHMIGLSDTTMKIDCCSNKTISADIHSDRLPNDKQTGSQMVISADGNRCGDYTFAQSPASFSGGLLDSPAFSDKAYLSDVVRRIHDKQEALGVEEVHLDPLPDSTQPVEGGTDDVTAEALLKTNTQIDGQCTQQANVDNVAVEGVNIDALQKPDTQHGGAEVEGVKVDVLQQTYTQQDERGAEQVRVNASEEPNIEHEGGGVNRLNIDRGVEGENADTLHEPNTNHEEKRAEQMHDDKGAMMNGVALQKVNTQHDEGDTERFNVEEGVMEEGGRDAQCIEDVNVDLLEKPDTEREAAGVKGFNVEIFQSGQGDTEQVNISEGAIDGVNIDVLPKPDRQHQEGGKEKADISIDVTGLDGKCIEEVTIHALLKASPQKGEVGIDGVNLDDSQETHTGHDDGLTEQFKVDAVQKPNACYEEGDVKGVNSDGKGIEGQELNVEVLGKNTTQHEERGLNAESIEEVHLDTLEGGVKVDRQESKTLQDEEGTVGINIDALQKSRTQLVEGGVKEGNSYEGGIETVNMDERAVEELIVEASLRPNTPIEERGSEMADTQRVNGGAEESVVDDLRDATTEEDRGSVTEDQDTMTRWSDMALTTEDEPLDSLQIMRLVLEDVAFDVQSFVSENTEFLSSAQSKHILKLLSTTQRAFREQTETVAAQRQALEGLLDARERDTQQQVVTEKQKEFASKLDELCDSLTLTENRLMGHQHEAGHADSVSDLQQYQQEHQALQKDVLTNAGALNDVISSTKKFLEENRAKMSPEQVAAVEKKLEEAKSKAKLINQRAEESRKDLEKVVTTAIKQESEKTAAVEQLEESKNKIEGLLGWISNIGNEKEAGTGSPGDVSKENGNLPEETSAAGAPGEEEEKEDDANGNGPDTAETDSVSRTNEKNARHQEILSQQQELIMATQSAQALLDKQAQVLAPEEQEKLQRDVQELRARYDASLTQAEQQMKQVQSVQEELGKFQGDSVEFEAWLDQAEAEMEELCAPGDGLDVLAQKLQRQKSFSEDVISHKGDLRFITISGQKVLDVAKACSSADAMDKGSQLKYKIHTLNTYLFYSTYFKYSSAELVKWLNSSEEEARRQQSEAIAADPQTLQIQLEDTKSLQGQMTGRQTAVETLRKTSDSLISCEGDLLSHPEAIQEIVDDIAERYDNLSKSVSDRNEKLQITLTRSMSVQDGLDEMMGWMQGLEDSVREKGSVPLDSPALGSLLSKEAALGQDIASRQSSISAIKAKVEKFAETADASAAAPLQSKMESLSRRLADTCDSHNLKVSGLEEVKDKVERFEKTAEEVQQFVQKRSQELRETDGPGKSFKELSQLVKDTTAEMAEHSKDLDMLKSLSKELCPINPEASKAQIQGRLDSLASDYSTLKDIVKEKEEEVSSCQDQLAAFRTAAGALTSWLEETDRKVPTLQPGSGGTQSLEKDLLSLNGLLEEWTAKGPAVQELNSQGAALCTHISALTSPAKKNGANKSGKALGLCGRPGSLTPVCPFTPPSTDLMVIQQNMSYVSEGYTTLEGRLRSSAAQLSELLEGVKETQKEADLMVAWLGDMKHKAASGNSEAGEKGSVKAQLEQQKEFEADMKQKQEKLQQLRQKLLHLLETHPDSPEAATWKQMLAEIDAAWDEVTSCAEERKQHLERSSRNLEAFHTAEPQLRQWLSEKELMMTVLGPLSVDLNMLKMQKQQVQILQNEFESRKPQYEELHKAAAAILDPTSSTSPTSPSSSSSEVQAVTEQLAGVTQKWEDVTGQLGSRAGLIDQAALKTGQLQELLKGLGAASGRLDAQLSGEQGQQHSTQPDAVKKQLEQVHSISAQLREERRRLKEAEAVATELTAMVTEDYLKADLARQLESVSKPFKQLEEKAGLAPVIQLASTFDSSQQFHRASEEFQTWLDERLREEASPRPVSAQVEPLQRSLTEHEALRRALSDHERPYATIAGEGEALLQDTDGAEKLALQGQLATLSSNWEAVKKGSADRGEALATALQRAVRYRDQAEKLSAWAEECEASRDRVQTAVDPVALESSLSQLKALQKDVDKHRGAVEQLNAAADSLLEAANADTDGVKEERAALGERVDKLAEGLQSKRESLEKTSQTLKDFNDTRKEAKSQIERAQKQVEAYESLGAQAHSTKTLTNMKAQQKSLEAVQSQLEQLKNLAKDLVVDVPDADGVTDLLLQADGLEKDYGSLNKKVEETCSTLEGKLQGIGQFQNDIREMYGEFTDLDDELDGMEPVALDLAALKDQQEGIQGFTTKLREVTANTVNAGENCRKMLETESSPELFGLKRDVDALSKQCGKLLDRARGREEQVVEARRHLEELHSKLRRSGEKLSRAVATEEAQGVVAVETEVINQQLEAFKVFEKEEIEPLQTELQDINSLGQALIQGAAKASSTQGLEDELDSINAKWNTLNKKVAERSAQLHEALLHCGRFQDALESLLSWLTDTEELVANQKAPSAEFKVVKAQIQEQKLLQRLLDDRKPTVELIKKEGGKVAELAESVDRDKVAREMEGLGQRWDTLLKKAENRFQLESILVVTQKFHETLEPLSDWLQATEKHLANSEPIGTESSKLEKQISQQKALQEDIKLRRQNVDQAIANGMELLKQTTGDEVVAIQGKLDGIKTKYAEIDTMSRGVCDNLQRVLGLSTELQGTHQELDSWLGGVEAEVSSFAGLKPVGEELTQAQDRQKAKERKPLVDKLNELSGSLLDLVPWHAREGLDKLVTADNERYRALSDAVTQHVDRINADMLKSQQFGDAADAELAWLSEAQDRLQSMGEIRLEQDQTLAQLQAQKVFSMDIMRHKDSVDELVKTGKAIMDSKSPEEKESQALVERYAAVCQLNSERCLQLERAQSLAGQFWETYEELCPWLQDTLAAFSQLHLPAIEYETLRRQQEELRQMRELIAEHKPHIDKMNKTGPQLLELSPLEGEPIREKYTATDRLYAKLKADVTQRAATLDEAISKSTQFHDKIDPMLESLERMSERLRQPPSISVEVEKIREQLTENKAGSMDLEKLQPSYEMLRQRGEEMIARSEGADKDLSAKAVQDKLDQMVFLWQDIQALQEEREAKLLDVMDLADKFWCEHCALLITTKDSQDLLKELEEPGVDPSVVKQQLEFVEVSRASTQGNVGLMADGGISKALLLFSVLQVNLAWENLDKTWKERVERLEEAMQAAVQFQDGLQGMFDWVDILESKLDSMPPVGTDVDTVKQQLADLKEYKGEAYQLQIELERLNHAAGLLLKKVTDEADRSAIQEPMAELKMLWDNLDEKIINRQHKLEGGLLALGQFQHALDELLAWMSHTDELLGEQRKAGGDPKAIEIELAKHHVLENDVLAHKTTVETVQRAGGELVQSSAGEEASALQTRLDHLNQRWTVILERTGLRRQQLESSLLQAQGFHGEIEDMQQWLKDTERQLLASKAVGGLPDTAREQLSVHLELCAALEAKEELYGTLVTKGQQLLTLSPEGLDSNTEQDLANLRDKWGAVRTKVAERKVKLEEALTVATDFHDSLQDFINWLTQAEQTLTMVSPASLIMDTVMFQIDEHKMFVTEVNGHRDHIIELDKTGTHLKYFSQKQDVVLIKNLLVSVQARWEKLLQRSVERGRMLDDARKRAKQFHETWTKLMDWLEESEKSLDSEVEIANDPDRIKAQLAQHKEFQKAVGSKHAVYDTTARTGRALKDKTGLKDDKQKLDDMLSELRDKWDTVCGKSVERQNKLEEALLISGQFTEALQALIDWLYKVEPQMAEDQPVHGDIDLVLNLIDNHKVFQKELGKRTVSVAALKRSARELLDSSHDDPTWVRAQMGELGGRWDTVCTLSVSKQSRLEQALGQAEEFHSTVHILLEWLAEAEQSLRFHGSLPDDEDALRALIEQHEGFMKKLEEKRAALNKATSLGEDILTICHPDSITTIKHWNTIIKARFEEVQAWARQHQQRLATALEEQQATAELLKGLLTWLQWAESSLDAKDKEALPQELEEVKGLIAQHQTFMEEMTRKQPDVDIITKTHKRKNAAEPAVQSQIPVLEKGRPGRKRSPTQALYQAASQTPLETKNPQVNLLVSKWQQVWLLALDRRRKLNDALDRLEELKEFDNFDFDVWRKKYMRWMNHKKSRVMDFFRRIDKDQDGKVTREEFIEGILSSRFPTSRLEMSAVADIFDRDGDGFIDYYEFVAALHPNKEAYKPLTDADKIEDEVTRQVAKCKCPKRFQVEQIGANKYRVRIFNSNLFGDSQQLRLVRILRSTVMVRVGGGWMALDEFLVKNDPCRAKGRTNLELREKFILPEGTTQIMASFRYRGRRSSRPSSRAASPNRSTSSHSCPAPAPNATPVTTVTSGTPKVRFALSIVRNYDKPWLVNSKPSSPLKSSDGCGSPGSSSEGTPVQGSKLRLPGYLSGKGFQSGEEGTLINNAVLKARAQAMERKNPSQPGSRGSSRRGSDASDFDISDIQSVCSDASENVGEHGRPSPRGSAARQHGGKPSKIPTPKRRATPTSKLAKGSKR
uniref:Dystonin n=1 Tax=Gadus morhua TaxID=8049 RepID=A0A8C5FBS2_GADMO